jgi:processive 1,2-diacylglycerol beta-glucosyltransferase
VGRFERVVESLLLLEVVLPGRLQLLVVCGEDDATRMRLQQRSAPSAMPIRVFGFVDYMADLMAASDLVVSKAGGLTVSEALGRGLPLVLYHVIPGQERMNAQYVVQRGAAMIALRAVEVAAAVRRFLEDPGRAEAMRGAARALSHPNAAGAIVSDVLMPLVNRRRP